MATCGSSIVTCPACAGSGFDSEPCAACGAKGRAGTAVCAACKGTGRRERSKKDCPRCAGKGKLLSGA